MSLSVFVYSLSPVVVGVVEVHVVVPVVVVVVVGFGGVVSVPVVLPVTLGERILLYAYVAESSFSTFLSNVDRTSLDVVTGEVVTTGATGAGAGVGVVVEVDGGVGVPPAIIAASACRAAICSGVAGVGIFLG